MADNLVSTPAPPAPAFPPAKGWAWVAIEDSDPMVRLITQPRRCRWTVGPGHRQCGRDGLIELQRGTSTHPQWWGYCLGDGHGYGRWLVNGKIMVWAQRPREAPDAPATVTSTP